MTHQAIADLDFEIQWNDTRAAKRANKKGELIESSGFYKSLSVKPDALDCAR